MKKCLLPLLLILGACSSEEYANTLYVDANDSPEVLIDKAVHVVPTAAQLHALDNGFAAFIHFGPNTFTGREWGTGLEDPSIFALESADTDQWCEILAAAGCRRVILTAKHHDGFVLWRSRYTRHGVVSSPYGGDIVGELSASCQKYGLEFGFYLSPADLHQMDAPGGLYGNGSVASLRRIPRDIPESPFADTRHFDAEVDDYNEYFMNQLFELLTEYGPISEIWFDGAHPKKKGGQQYAYQAWREMIRTLAPDAVIFGKEDLRWCGNEAGETRLAEWNVIPYSEDPLSLNMFADLKAEDLGSREALLAQPRPLWLHYQPAETDVSIRNGWFWRNDDEQTVRSADNVIDIWERSVGGNTILLLNVPPNRFGRISPRDSAVLIEVGQRLRDAYDTDLLQGASRKETADGLEITLQEPVVINRLSLSEDITRGERVEAFAVDYWNEGWQPLASGENIGHRRILRFPDTPVSRLRIRVLASRAEPNPLTVRAHRIN